MTGTEHRFYPLGDSAVVVKFGDEIHIQTHQQVIDFAHQIEQHPFNGFIECVPAFTTVTVYYDPYRVWLSTVMDSPDEGAQRNRKRNRLTHRMISPYQIVCDRLKPFLAALHTDTVVERNIVHIPVCYGGDFGPDLEFVAEHNGIGIDEVIEYHTKPTYPVFMIGFAPGFPYLGGMSERIAAPRRSSPRSSIPAGSVGIAGKQTGIYPIESPGGWQIIGRTPLKLFQPDHDPPSLLSAGDRVRFYAISREAFESWEVNSQ